LILQVLKQRLRQPDTRDGFLLVGFPRTTAQALLLDELLDRLGQPLDLVLLLEGDADHFMERLEGRRICRSCGAAYNIFSNPPRVEGVCDICGSRIRQRGDDNEDTIANRMRVYEQQTASLIQYYKLHGKLHLIDADASEKQVFGRLCNVLEEYSRTPDQGRAEGTAALKSSRTGAAAVKAKKTAPKKATPKRAAPKKTAPKKATPKKAAPKKAAPKKTTPKKAAPKKAAPKKAAPKKAAPKKAAPKKAAPKKAAPKKAAPKKAAPKKAAPKKAAPKKAAPKKAAPKKAAPKKAVPKKAAPKKAAPKKAAPKKATPKKATPKKAAQKKKAAPKKTPRKQAAPRKKRAVAARKR
ncbi:MAG TPA: adenylate kinase, partial [Sedimenticola thiotaurini]|nr:adenylate kinase [Sedimenticola thiotaurini]